MSENENKVRNIIIRLRVNSTEKELLKKFQQRTVEKCLSNYIRKVCLHKPVIVKYRNETADTFLQEMILLKKELNAVGNNFNQAVRKLHVLDKIPEFRSWLATQQSLQQELIKKIAAIEQQMVQLYEQWSQR